MWGHTGWKSPQNHTQIHIENIPAVKQKLSKFKGPQRPRKHNLKVFKSMAENDVGIQIIWLVLRCKGYQFGRGNEYRMLQIM
jgi:hypothetical protein